ncbi:MULTISPECIES: hypothetical protein [unclassified Beijerinckia]|uniref:hypothetical protein n=1 Tax=unclassified Beijerinckia TaxID=2638183 RepID=UPI001114BDDC|nr:MULTISPECIES: hypothetical protein [unclassified Beijerinckia]
MTNFLVQAELAEAAMLEMKKQAHVRYAKELQETVVLPNMTRGLRRHLNTAKRRGVKGLRP